MKRRNFWKWALGACLAVLPLVGCLPSGSISANAADATNTTAVAQGTVTNTNATATAITGTNATEAAEAEVMSDEDIASAPARKITPEVALPPSISPGSPSAEVVKMANAGVDEGVMLTYVTNSASTFNLSADQIIYLKDIGVPETVVTAMLNRDQVVRSANPAAAAQQAQAQAAQAAPDSNTTHYWTQEGQPAPEGQQPASEVAPQYDGTQPTPEPVPQQAPAEVTYNNFYNTLSPYGSWLEIEGYGRVWQPTTVVVNPGWRPYYDGGRWVYTDYGWYWLSDYSWGWAPFHYGRWFRHHYHGWCWAPDLVWGPSWVSWRHYDTYAGWAPLPPSACWRPGFGFSYYGRSVGFSFDFGLHHNHYSFVHLRHFRAHRLHAHRLPEQQVTQIYNKTVVVNRIVGNNNVVVNNGIPVSRVAAVSKQPVNRLAVRPTSSRGSLFDKGERVDSASRTLTVYRPQTAPARNDSSSIVQRMARNEPRRTATSATAATSGSLFSGATRGTTTVDRNAVARPQANTGSIATRPERPATTSGSVSRETPATTQGNLFSSSRERQSPGSAMTRTRPATTTTPATRESATAPAATTPANSGTTVTREGPRGSESLVMRGPSRQPTPAAPRTGTSPALTENGNRSTAPANPPASGGTPSRNLFTPRDSGVDLPLTRPTPSPSVTTPARVAPSAPTAPTAPVVPQAQPRTETRSLWSRPETRSAAPAPMPQAPAQSAPRVENRWSQPQPSYSRPSAPQPMPQQAPAYRAEPRYSAPTVDRSPSYSRPAPTYSAPSAPVQRAPSFSAPRAEPSRPAVSAPPSAPRSSGGSLFSGSRGRGRD